MKPDKQKDTFLSFRCSEEFRVYLKVYAAAHKQSYKRLILSALALQYPEMGPYVQEELRGEEVYEDELTLYRGSYDKKV